MTNDNPSRKDLKKLKKIEKIKHQNLEQKQNMVKWITFSIAGFIFLTLFVFLIIFIKGNDNTQTLDSTQATIATFSDGSHIRGNVNAPITLTEFADIQCPACRTYHPIVRSLLDIYGEDLRVDFKHFPISSIHPNAVQAAIAAEAAGKQEKFFEMVDVMYEKLDEWEGLSDPKDKFEEYAKNLELDVDQYTKDLEDPTLSDKIEFERNDGILNGVNSTPAFFLNGRRIENPANLDEFQQLIDAEIVSLGLTKSESLEEEQTDEQSSSVNPHE